MPDEPAPEIDVQATPPSRSSRPTITLGWVLFGIMNLVLLVVVLGLGSSHLPLPQRWFGHGAAADRSAEVPTNDRTPERSASNPTGEFERTRDDRTVASPSADRPRDPTTGRREARAFDDKGGNLHELFEDRPADSLTNADDPRELDAAQRLAIAIGHVRRGALAIGRRRLRSVIDDFPGTVAAERAGRLLLHEAVRAP